ncbi:MAG TPA: hypothetical protein VGB71_13810 [Flavisolibacter sp.]
MEQQATSNRNEHYMQCPDCDEWFDMRDLEAVFNHEHWIHEKIGVRFSHVKKLGRENEVYIKAGNKMITLKVQKQNIN